MYVLLYLIFPLIIASILFSENYLMATMLQQITLELLISITKLVLQMFYMFQPFLSILSLYPNLLFAFNVI